MFQPSFSFSFITLLAMVLAVANTAHSTSRASFTWVKPVSCGAIATPAQERLIFVQPLDQMDQSLPHYRGLPKYRKSGGTR